MADTEQALRTLIDTILDERGYKPRETRIIPVEAHGANYTSSLYTITVTSPNRDDLNLFAKVSCLGDAMRAAMKSDWMFSTEKFVYTQLVNIYNDIEEQNNVPAEHRFVFPKFYGCNAELGMETEVMENLAEAGFKSYDRFFTMDWEHAKVAVEDLAKFHALSFAFAKYQPQKFEELTSNMKFMLVVDEPGPNIMKALWASTLDNCLEVLRKEDRDRVSNLLIENLMDKYNKPIGQPVLVHGDYRLSNLLFRTQGGSLQSIAVDYQTVHAGCPVADLLYFIFLGSDEEFRRQYYDRLLDHYFSSLQQALERLGVEPSVYTREKFRSDIKELLPYVVLYGVIVLPTILVQSEAEPNVLDDIDVNNFVFKLNDLYAQRFKGIISDCVRLGAI